MREISKNVPNGLSWGIRGFFRIGKSVRGNWWVSIQLPFGFRYVWMLGSQHPEKPEKPDIDRSRTQKQLGQDVTPESLSAHTCDNGLKQSKYIRPAAKSKIIKK